MPKPKKTSEELYEEMMLDLGFKSVWESGERPTWAKELVQSLIDFGWTK